jgi:hypothetical protein
MDLSNSFNPCPKPEKKVKEPYKGLKRTAIKYKPKGNTDQSDAMQEKYAEQNGICEITGLDLGEYDPFKVHHYISKKTYPELKNEKRAMIVIDPDIHFSYHNNSKEYVLGMWPKAIILYTKAEELRIECNNKKRTV